ncbi:MAG: hypothetical protein WCK31_03475 [bacterium]
MKRIVFTILVIALLLVLAVISPWKNFQFSLESLLGNKVPVTSSSLEVSSLGGKLIVDINNTEVGKTSVDESKLEISPVEVGTRKVTIKRDSLTPYYVFERDISFEKGVSSVISWESGPNYNSSAGWILTPTKKNVISTNNDVVLSFITSKGDELYIDDVKTDQSNITVDPTKTYKISIKRDGYLPLSFQLFGFDNEKASQVKSYDFLIETKLAEIPIKVNEIN